MALALNYQLSAKREVGNSRLGPWTASEVLLCFTTLLIRYLHAQIDQLPAFLIIFR